MSKWKSLFQCDPFDPKQPYGTFHFYVVQFLVFLYLVYRLLSRDYAFYGLMDISQQVYPRAYVNWLFVSPPKYFTFHFLHDIFGYPSQLFLKSVQWIVISSGVMGLLGIKPKHMAMIAFVGFLYLAGFIFATNAELDGSELLLCALLILSLSHPDDFYSISSRPSYQMSPHAGFSVFLLFLFCGAYYTFAGINKIVDYGPHWPFDLNLYNVATECQLAGTVLSSRYVISDLCFLMDSRPLSPAFGFITLFGELGFISILFWPRMRWFFVFSMIWLHTLVLVSAGINFTGNSFILLLCLDWNTLYRSFCTILSKYGIEGPFSQDSVSQ